MAGRATSSLGEIAAYNYIETTYIYLVTTRYAWPLDVMPGAVPT